MSTNNQGPIPRMGNVGVKTPVWKNWKAKFKFQSNGTSKGHTIPEPFDRQLPGTDDPKKPNYRRKLPKRTPGVVVPRFHNPFHVQLLDKFAKEPGPMPPTVRNRGRITPLIGVSDTRRIRPIG